MTNITASSNNVGIYANIWASNNSFYGITIQNSSQRGMYLDVGTNNFFSQGIINASGDNAIYITGMVEAAINTTFINLTISNTNAGYYDINFGSNVNGTSFIDMPSIGNYTFYGVGGTIIVKKTGFGEVRLLRAVNG